jgi:hypothetical protein
LTFAVQIDPMGAIIIAVCVMISWCRTIYGSSNNSLVRYLHMLKNLRRTEQFTFLAGIAAPVDFQQLVIYKVRRRLCDPLSYHADGFPFDEL